MCLKMDMSAMATGDVEQYIANSPDALAQALRLARGATAREHGPVELRAFVAASPRRRPHDRLHRSFRVPTWLVPGIVGFAGIDY